jgi:chorismate-pyruvate lyase
MSSCLTNGTTPLVLPFAHPLDELYAKAGLTLPCIEAIPGHEVPSPFQQLLVHQGDMTPALEAFHESSIHLDVLRREQRNDFYFREVLLRADDSNRVVEFGAIKIHLALFPPAARQEILRERLPLGTILARYKIEHTSRPKAFLRVLSDDFINSVLGLGSQHTLYGRRNTVSNSQQRSLAEIVEILPPVSEASHEHGKQK